MLLICADAEKQVNLLGNGKKETATLVSREVAIGGHYWEVYSEKRSKREVFRAYLGDREVRWWTTGIVVDEDLNADGRPDYVWSGGDDTSEEVYLIVSGKSGYRSISVYPSLAGDWVRRYGGPKPDLALFGTYMPKSLILDSASGSLRIKAEFEWAGKTRKVSVSSAQFVPVRQRVLRINPSPNNPARRSSSR
ncbi:MAG: hypothetical protein SFV18_09395 [Bryobacteraceae bacterium]|nr:hypothetical protein [Bryobacteraceae bacterium]